ncbi:MAG: aspartate-semialdehyde dehydrogenase [Oscillospiraceae bacterium]|nr:aspartate-semialdehyde dehydrogenase [Oscillospiraceae bacterium]
MGLKVGVLGVGPVGEHIVRVLGERKFPLDGEIIIIATSGRNEIINGKSVSVQKVSADIFKGLDLVFFAGKEGAKGASMEWADIAVESGCIVIDNGGDLRMYPNIPLVVPEINMDAVTKETRLICNPNCSTIQMAVALYPLHKAARLRRVVVSTYQSVSGHSGAGMDQLNSELKQVFNGEPIQENPAIFARSIAFNCIPHIDRFEKNGYTREEMKMVHETRKIFGEPDLLISATTVRVPVLVGHAETINAEFMEPMRAQRAIEILSDSKLSPGVVCFGEAERYPVPSDLEKDEWKDAVLVGRIRDDMTAPNAVNLWCVSDNLRKGAAANAVQIAEGMLAKGLL